jgi:hypothetical protein
VPAVIELESLEAEPRQRAYEWLAAHDIDDDAAAYRRALAAATA